MPYFSYLILISNTYYYKNETFIDLVICLVRKLKSLHDSRICTDQYINSEVNATSCNASVPALVE